MQKWEYKLVLRSRKSGFSVGSWDVDIEKLLLNLGDQGFELVAISPRSSNGGETAAGVTTEELWVFKRPKS